MSHRSHWRKALYCCRSNLRDRSLAANVLKLHVCRLDPYIDSEERLEQVKYAEAIYEHLQGDCPKISSLNLRDRLQQWLRQWLSEPIGLSIGDRNIKRPIWQPLAAVLVISLSVLIWALFFYQSAITRGLNALNEAYAAERPVEARISGFGYAKYFAGQNDSVVKLDPPNRDTAIETIASHAAKNRTPAAYHALSKLYITEQRFGDAIKYLQLALNKDTNNAKLHNDLAVALMSRERAKKSGESTGEGLAEALEHLHRAIELDGSLLEAYFNLALCHQYQMLWRTAAEDWKKYLEKDSQSQWAEETRKNLKDVEGRIKQVVESRERLQKDFQDAYQRRNGEQVWLAYKQSRLSTESFITDKLIDDYLLLALSGESAKADDKLQALLFIGDLELEKVGDRFTYDLAQFYRAASLQQLQKVSEARALIKDAHAFFRQSLIDRAVNKYQQARDIFNRTGDAPEALAAQRRAGHCHYRLANTKLSLPALTQGAQDCENRAYLWLLGMYHNDLVNVNIRLMRYSRAIDHGQSMLAYARRIEDEHGIRRGLNRVADVYMQLARHRDSLPLIQEGLSLAASPAPLDQIIEFYTKASISYIGLGKLTAALDYEKEACKLSLEINNPWLTAHHFINLGLVYDRIENHAEAIKLIRDGVEIGKKLPDAKMGKDIAARSNLYLGQIYLEMGDLDNAAKHYSESLQLYNENDIDSPLTSFEAKKGMLLTHIQQRDVAVQEELKQVIDIYEEHRNNIEDESSRNSFFHGEQGIYDIAIEFAYFYQQNARQAFDYSELSRARSLLDAVDLSAERMTEENLPIIRLPRSIRPFTLDQIQGRLPSKTCLIQYAVLDDKIIVWLVSNQDLKSQSIDVNQNELNNKVSAYLELLASSLDDKKRVDYRAPASELYNLLIKPIELLLPKDAEICVVPDKTLNRLPFASLISPVTGKYLIEERAIFTSPSANMFVVATEKARQKESVKVESLLSIGNPAFDKDLFRNLKDLPWATSQALKIATFYQTPAVLLERDAREAAIRKILEKSDVAHFAMHYVADERSPLLSFLPLAEEKALSPKDRDGIVYTYEFYKMNLARLRLVVLSACQTGIEQYYKGEGAIGLARAFEAAGIPLVVASLWPVESYPSKELMISFHQHRKRDGLPTVEALRRAQMDMIGSTDPQLRNPYHWAAYTVIGGHANF